MFKLLLVPNETNVNFCRRINGAVMAFNKFNSRGIARDHVSNAWLVHRCQLIGEGPDDLKYHSYGTIDHRTTKTADGKQTVIKASTDPLQEGINYNFDPLDEIISAGIMEAIKHTHMARQFDLDIENSDVIEKVKHSIKTEIENKKIFGDFTTSVEVSDGFVTSVTVTVRA